MLTPAQSTQIKDLINSSQTILIFFPEGAKTDVQMAAKALHLSLASLQAKDVSLLSPKKIKELEEVKTEVGNKNLQISFPYIEGMVDKVSYDIDEELNRFYLLIQPASGTKPLDYKQIEYAYTGAEADLVFLVAVPDYEKLEHLYQGYESMYEDATVIALNTYESSIGDVKIDGSGKTGISEMVVELVENLELGLPVEAATSLLSGLESVTDNFASLTATADTFEMAAKLMRMGARRTKKPVAVIAKKDNFANALNKKPSFAKASKGKPENILVKKAKNKVDPGLRRDDKGKKKLGGLDHKPGIVGK